ncbi:hypothetical protein [Rossellomorea aquimaris]|uniref:hypothetical protein n=1 Tax=Rossellomorea aquimaris TaxID=189382 RepID=UPI0011E943AB|nr:hypothetical protein [Rossellomorea aquimaris]TYS91898.1 hypothetical protein FZC88_07125 [Rossellomorea aquimaris]
MKNLIQSLYTIISQSTTWSVYDTQANQNAVYPYIVFKLPNSNNTESDREDFIIEVDLWDDKTFWQSLEDTERLYEEVSKVNDAMKKARILNEHHLLIFSKLNQLQLPDPDENIRRIQLRYEVKTYER